MLSALTPLRTPPWREMHSHPTSEHTLHIRRKRKSTSTSRTCISVTWPNHSRFGKRPARSAQASPPRPRRDPRQAQRTRMASAAPLTVMMTLTSPRQKPRRRKPIRNDGCTRPCESRVDPSGRTEGSVSLETMRIRCMEAVARIWKSWSRAESSEAFI
jgi:hypothetical protein